MSEDVVWTVVPLVSIAFLLILCSMRIGHLSWYSLYPRSLGYLIAGLLSVGFAIKQPWLLVYLVPMWVGAIWLALGRTPLWLRRLTAWTCDPPYKEQILQGPSFYPRWWDPNDPRRLVRHRWK